MREDVRLAKARIGVVSRASDDRSYVAASLASHTTKNGLKVVVKPPSASNAVRNVGAVLLVSPDPFTGIPGAALMGASYVMKGREAASLKSLAKETASAIRTVRDLQSLL